MEMLQIPPKGLFIRGKASVPCSDVLPGEAIFGINMEITFFFRFKRPIFTSSHMIEILLHTQFRIQWQFLYFTILRRRQSYHEKHLSLGEDVFIFLWLNPFPQRENKIWFLLIKPETCLAHWKIPVDFQNFIHI